MKTLIKLGLAVVACGAISMYGDYRQLKGYLRGVYDTAKAYNAKDND